LAARYAQLRPFEQATATPPRPAPPPSVPRPEAERLGPSINHRGAAPGIGR
jgi:exodeoxyribonuclease V alpha subunit